MAGKILWFMHYFIHNSDNWTDDNGTEKNGFHKGTN